ncbi:MAG: hypothetical protein JWO56_1714 [Acidobacteria bacterium]|nr:hypothetical protein [Acidobacteriota bacterium]
MLLLRGAIGFAIGVAFWIGLRGPYHELIANVAGPILKKIEPAVTWVRPVGDRITIDRNDLPRTVEIDVRIFTFNTILLFTFFAANRRTLSRRNLGFFALSFAVLALTQAIAVVAGAESLFSQGFGDWSDEHYSALASDVSLIVAQGYMLVGGYAVVFALWWLTREPA